MNRYGISDHVLTHKLVEHAKQLPSSFDPVAPRKYGFSSVLSIINPFTPQVAQDLSEKKKLAPH